jgi:hypothetical protein
MSRREAESVEQCISCGEDFLVYDRRQFVDGEPMCPSCRRYRSRTERAERRAKADAKRAEAHQAPSPACDHDWQPLAPDAPARQWGATRYCAKCLKADKEKPQDENMIEQDTEKQRIAEAMVKYVHGRTLGPNMKADEARDLIRAYLRLEGFRPDSYGNFKSPSDPKHRYHFSKQRVQFQRRGPGGWSNVDSYLPGDMARRIVTAAARTAGETALADKFMAGRKAAAKRKIAGQKREEKRRTEVDARQIAQKAFAAENPDIALKIGSRVKVPSGKFAVAKERIHNLSMQWADHIAAGGAPPPDSAFATVDYPPVLPVFFPYTYDWTETVDGVEYSIHVEHGEGGTANVMIGAHGSFGIDPVSHRMFVPKHKAVGDAQISGRIVWDDSGKELAGMLFMITALNKGRGAGSRVMQLWCRMMRGYGIEAWIGEAVGPEGMAFLKAMDAKGKLAILGGDSRSLVVACTGQLPPMRKPKGAKPSSKRPDTPAIVEAVIAGAAGQKRPSKRPSPKRPSSKQATSYLVEMMQWDGMQQIEDRKQRVKSMGKAIEMAIDFVKGRPRPKLAKVFVTAMDGRSKLGMALLLMGKDGVWHVQESGGLESKAQADFLMAGLGEAQSASTKPNPVGDGYFQPNPMYQPNPPWADKLLVKDWKVLSDQAQHLKMPMPVREGQAKSFAELGCGRYGCVYPTSDESVVFKLTSDPDEIRFVEAAMAIGDFPAGIVRYYATAPMLGKYRKRDVIGIWREAAVEVGMPTYYGSPKTTDEQMFNRATDLLMGFKNLAHMVKVYAKKHPNVRRTNLGTSHDFSPEDFKIDWFTKTKYRSAAEREAGSLHGVNRVRYCLDACRYLAELMVNDRLLYYIGEALLFYMTKGILLADVHRGNVGQVVREDLAREPIWVITDPGHAVSVPPIWSFVEPDVAEASAMTGLEETRSASTKSNPVGDGYFQPNPMYQPNPPWADKLLVKDWKVLSDQARHLKMPMPVREGQAKSFAELGCGVYGCVYPTADESVVFKLTSDPDEIRFVEAAMAIGDFPAGIVRYYATALMLGKYRKRDVIGIWREAAVEVGLPTYLARATNNDERMFNRAGDLLMQFKDIAYLVKQYAMKRPDKVREIKMGEIPDFEPEDFKIDWYSSDRYRYRAQRRAAGLRGVDRVRYCLNACRYLAESMVNDQILYHVGEALLFYMAKGILLADVHRGNVGQVVREDMAREPIWVITDPGHAVSIPPVWSFVEPDVAEASAMNPTGSYTMGIEKPTAEAIRRWAKRARRLGMQVTTKGNRGIATGTPDQWEQAKMIVGAPDLTWVWDESLRGPATHQQIVRRSGTWFADATPAPRRSRDLDAVIMRVILGVYGNWRIAKRYEPKRREPCMTVGRIKDELDQRTVHAEDYAFSTDKKKTSLIRSAVRRMVRDRKLAESEGIGLKGRAATCYEPVLDNPAGRPVLSIRKSKDGGFTVTGTDKFGNKVSQKASNREEAKAIRGAYARIISDHPELVEREVARIRAWYARPRSNPVGNDPYVYHVTFYNRLGAIASGGLMPIGGMHGSALGKGGYAGHSQGKVFVTERDGISFWYGRAEDAANDSSDDVLVEGYTPVVLRMPKPKGMKLDEAGTDDAGYDAWYVKKAIDPDRIEAWTGTAWAPVGRAEDIIDQAASYDMEDGYAYLKSDWENPLVSFLQEGD